jgi:hypothetical protein
MKKPTFICSICQRACEGFGNNAEPVNDGRCCDRCDNEIVIPARIRQMQRFMAQPNRANKNRKGSA